MFNELTVIRDLKSRFKSRSDNVILGIGDDCAAVKPGSGVMLYSTDTVTEGIHFLTSYMTFSEIAAKSVSAAVSDIAAMGANELRFVLVSLGLPAHISPEFVDRFYGALQEALRQQLGDIRRRYEQMMGNSPQSFGQASVVDVAAGARLRVAGHGQADVEHFAQAAGSRGSPS